MSCWRCVKSDSRCGVSIFMMRPRPIRPNWTSGETPFFRQLLLSDIFHWLEQIAQFLDAS